MWIATSRLSDLVLVKADHAVPAKYNTAVVLQTCARPDASTAERLDRRGLLFVGVAVARLHYYIDVFTQVEGLRIGRRELCRRHLTGDAVAGGSAADNGRRVKPPK